MTYLDTKSAFQKEAETMLKKEGFTNGSINNRLQHEQGYYVDLYSRDAVVKYKDSIIAKLIHTEPAHIIIAIEKHRASKSGVRVMGITKNVNVTNYRATYSNGYISVINTDTGMRVNRFEFSETIDTTTRERIRYILKTKGITLICDRKMKYTAIEKKYKNFVAPYLNLKKN